jgi:hypothetical protein
VNVVPLAPTPAIVYTLPATGVGAGARRDDEIAYPLFAAVIAAASCAPPSYSTRTCLSL